MKSRTGYTNMKRKYPIQLWLKPAFYCFLLAALICSVPSFAQKTQLVQVKAFDQQLAPYKNVEISINGKEFIAVGTRGTAFVELTDSDLPLKSIKIKDEKLEAASWNYSKGIIEVIIRARSYQLTQIVVKNQSNAALPNLKLTFKGRTTTTVMTNAEGQAEIPLALDEKAAPDQFVISNFRPVKVQTLEGKIILIVEPIKVSQAKEPTATATVGKNYFRDFDLSKLDSIQSLTVFYAIFKNYQIKDMSEEVKVKIDAKFNQLVKNLQDSLLRNDKPFTGKISDSSFVNDDIKNLLSQATQESQTLALQRTDFDQKISIIQEKLESGFENLDNKDRAKLLSDLTLLEGMLMQNENQFYKNQNDYRQIINSLKDKFFDTEDLENKLSLSEAQRLEEKRAFRQKIIITLSVLIVFAILILLLIHFSTRLRKQKKELVRVNVQIKRINENLEALVAERTKLLAEANKELDTFLYRASHDLRSPVCSIIGLCNIALLLSNGESRDLVERMVLTTSSMDKLLKKLSIISEINQPTNFSSITLVDVVENMKEGFSKLINDQRINFIIDCPADIVIYSYPNLIETILANLVENAFFYSVLKDSKNAQVELSAAVKDDHLVLSLYDNGIGMDDSITHRLFDMFFKGNENSKGNGLGLYIVQKSVQALEGRIEVESEPGKFTKFVVHIPLKPMTFNPKTISLDSSPLLEIG